MAVTARRNLGRFSIVRGLTFAAVGILALGLTACQGQEEAQVVAANESSSAQKVAKFDPKLVVTPASKDLKVTDELGTRVSLAANYPVAELTGVDSQIADDFAQTVADNHLSQVDEQLQRYSSLGLIECAEELNEQKGKDICERDSSSTLEHAGIYEDYATVATRSGFILGSRDRNPQAHSVTMNLKTGKEAALEDFIDLESPAARERAIAALESTDHWQNCEISPADETAAGYLSKALAFSPTDDGLLLLWAPNTTYAAQCQVDKVMVPWDSPEAPKESATGTTSGPATAEGVNGSWCPTLESPKTEECVKIALPKATYEAGGTVQLSSVGKQDGGFAFAMTGAPFGTYYPAGVAIDIPEYYAGKDLPEQDRIWNGQTATMMIRD